jgi:hypothetical protein
MRYQPTVSVSFASVRVTYDQLPGTVGLATQDLDRLVVNRD